MRRHPTALAGAHDRPRARVASGSCVPYGPRGAKGAGEGVRESPPPPATAAEDGGRARSEFLRALRSPRPVARLDGAALSDPLTTALSRFTGTG